MGTSSLVGVKASDGTITGCYIHYDGYPENMVSAIASYIDNKTVTGLVVLIVKAQQKGGIRCLAVGEDPEFLEDPDPCVVDELAWADDHFGVPYKYLVDYETGDISVYDKHDTHGGRYG
jgi:hypothetical protein